MTRIACHPGDKIIMATIRARRQADGGTRYTAVIRIRRAGVVIHQEARTFALRTAATSWAKHREVALEDPVILAKARQGSCTLSSLIRWYIDSFRSISKWQRTKQSQLEFLERHPFGASDALTLTTASLIDHVRSRRVGGAGPATVGNDLTWIGVVLRAAKSVKQLPVPPGIVEEARAACHELRLISKSRRRKRRPTAEEKQKLDQYFRRRDKRSTIQMFDVWHFAIESAKREAEICRLEWTDIDEAGRTGLVRDAKHPYAKEGNHKRFKLTPEAWAIVQRQPRASRYIFPYNPKSISTAFTRACHLLGIIDLRFHDGRHEGTSQLFERGYQIHEVAQITLHDSWNELKRYTNLQPENLRDLPPAQPAAKARQRGTTRRPAKVNRPSGAVGRSVRRGRMHSPATATSVRQA